MVSRADFQSAIDAAKVPMLGLMTPPPAGADKPNIEVSKTVADQRPFLAKLYTKVFGFNGASFAEYPADARAAVRAAQDSLERRLARALDQAATIEGPTLKACVLGMHLLLEQAGYVRTNRFGLLSASVWQDMEKSDPEFRLAPSISGAKPWLDVLWMRSEHLQSKAAMFHRRAVEGAIEAFDPSPGQSASAAVTVRLIEGRSAGVRILKW